MLTRAVRWMLLVAVISTSTNADPEQSAPGDDKNTAENAAARKDDKDAVETAPEFTLEDQFRKSHTIAYPADKASVFVLADKEGSKQVEAWVRTLYDAFQDRVNIHGIALLKGVPSALRPTIRYLFKKQVNYPVMLDWEGTVTESFAFKPGQACVFVVNMDGSIVLSEYGPADTARGERVLSALLLASASSKKAGH